MRVMKTLPREVEVHRCDAPGCENWCDAPDPTVTRDTAEIANRDYISKWGAGCGWLALPQELSVHIQDTQPYGAATCIHDVPTQREFRKQVPVYVCSWECLAALVALKIQLLRPEHSHAGDNPYTITTEFHRLLPRAA